jgi:hypothetical protein
MYLIRVENVKQKNCPGSLAPGTRDIKLKLLEEVVDREDSTTAFNAQKSNENAHKFQSLK